MVVVQVFKTARRLWLLLAAKFLASHAVLQQYLVKNGSVNSQIRGIRNRTAALMKQRKQARVLLLELRNRSSVFMHAS